MFSRNGMDGLSLREAAPKVINHTWNEMGSYVHPEPNKKNQQKSPDKKQKPSKQCMTDSEMHGLMSMFFGDSTNKGNKKDSWRWYKFCTDILGLELQTAKTYWNKSLKDHFDAIKKYADYDPVVVQASNGIPYAVPTMTKSGMYFMLSQEVKGLWKESVRNKQAARILAQFIADDASNIANGGANAASSAPMQQSCSPVEAPDASPMQVLAVCAHDMLLRHLS